MAGQRVRSALGSVVGWVLVVLLVLFVARTLLSSIFWLVRSLLVVVALVGLFVAYVVLKAPDDE